MKTSIIYMIMGLLMINTLYGQVKIGDNPQNLNSASVLELESTSRVLVITRLTDAQMNVINPLRGALAYNTDQDCLHYYDGTEWINICDELDNSFTVSTRADYLSTINPQAIDNTVVISEVENPDGSINYNFEVGQINSANIVTGGVNGDDIQSGVIVNRHIVDGTINKDKFLPASQNGDMFMWNGSTWNFVNQSDLLSTQLDSIVGNEVVGPFDSTLERLGAGIEGDPYTLDVTDGGIDTAELANDAVTSDKIDASVAGTGLSQAPDGSLEVDNANIAPDWTTITGIPADIDDGDDDTTYSAGLGLSLTGNTFSVDNANIAPDWASITGIPADINDGDDDTTYSAGLGLSLTGNTFSVDNANIAPDWASITGIPADIDDGDDDTTYSAGLGLSLTGNTFSVDNANIAPDWTSITGIPADIDDGDDDTTYSAGLGLSLTGNTFSVDNANIAPDWASITGIPADIDDGDDDTTYSAGLGINIDPSNVISTTNLAGDVTGPINSNSIAPGVITNSQIAAGAAIDGSKINPVFTSDVTTTGDFIDLTPDFVFQKYFNGYSSLNNDYKFRSLDEIESFIKENNHLPGIKSAHQVKTQGKYFLTESSMAQLEKIEELFLHTIEQEKKIEQLQSENQNLTKELDSIKEDLAKIKALLLNKSNN
ncbi:bZIP transcription factor [Allomuricauda sp. F6463D]|uniref:bZIP transcription factor n=1 Tax=Allomuricauda sp. F6463D TaxID=2926409 RepID=UPI001FF572CA|nr:bZIP transcription factor [Muricauda sp. F6463D]MCK0161869.1 bZIP transcription factor [Muricauda sp. F6463D]